MYPAVTPLARRDTPITGHAPSRVANPAQAFTSHAVTRQAVSAIPAQAAAKRDTPSPQPGAKRSQTFQISLEPRRPQRPQPTRDAGAGGVGDFGRSTRGWRSHAHWDSRVSQASSASRASRILVVSGSFRGGSGLRGGSGACPYTGSAAKPGSTTHITVGKGQNAPCGAASGGAGQSHRRAHCP